VYNTKYRQLKYIYDQLNHLVYLGEITRIDRIDGGILLNAQGV
jgi:hypothetical protein